MARARSASSGGGVAADRHHLVGAQHGRGLHRDLNPARPRLDVRPLPVAKHAPGVDEVPEPPHGGRHAGRVLPPPASDAGDREPAGMEQREGADVGTEVGAAEDGPLAPGQRGVQVLAAADLDQFPQGPGPAPQPHQVDDLAGADPEEVPGQALSLFRAELLPEHLAQVTHYLGALLRPGTGKSSRPASRRHGRRGGQAGALPAAPRPASRQGLRRALSYAHLPPGSRLPAGSSRSSATAARLARLPGPERSRRRWRPRCRNSRDEVHVVHRDAEPLLDENHQPEQAQRVKDARLEQRRRVPERQQARVLDEFLLM